MSLEIAVSLAIAVLTSCIAGAQTAPKILTPEEVVRAYTDAANRHDLDAFLALYADDVRKFRFAGEMASQGIAHNREIYTKSFAAAPDLKIDIVEMIVLGDKVMVHDRVTGRPDGKAAEELTVYQVRDGRIANIVYVEQLVKWPGPCTNCCEVARFYESRPPDFCA